MSTWYASLVLPCTCGVDVYVLVECAEDPKGLQTVGMTCWHCGDSLGRLPAVAVWTDETAAGARAHCDSIAQAEVIGKVGPA
jgi:hypothetical protein